MTLTEFEQKHLKPLLPELRCETAGETRAVLSLMTEIDNNEGDLEFPDEDMRTVWKIARRMKVSFQLGNPEQGEKVLALQEKMEAL